MTPPGTSPRGRAWPSSDDTTFVAFLILAGAAAVYAYLAWMHFHAEISRGFALLAHWHIWLIQFVSADYDGLDQQLLTADYDRVTLKGIRAAATGIGTWFRVPVAVLLVGLAIVCFFRAPSARFTKRLDLDGLIAAQMPFFRTVAAFGARRLRLRQLRDGEPRPADPSLHAGEWLARFAVVNGRLRPQALRAELVRQLGPRWKGPAGATPHVRVLFAAFALHHAQRRQEALALLGDLSEALRPTGAEEATGPETPMTVGGVLAARADTIIAGDAGAAVAKHAARHAYTVPALMTVLVEAHRRGGVLPPAAFNAVKLVDRRLWYALHSLGFPLEAHGRTHHPNPCVEAAGSRDHWAVECASGGPVSRPAVERAAVALTRFHALSATASSAAP